MFNPLALLFGTPTSKFLKANKAFPAAVGALEPALQGLSDAALADLTVQLKAKLQQGASLDSLKVEAFAAVREAARRALGLRAFDVQLLGGLALHGGNIAEMKTGEGKTLVATFAAYLNALAGKGVHVVTVNDYLAKRDAAWMGAVFIKLGMTTAAIYHGQDGMERKAAYEADITYATNNELGFDYLRDHMALHPSQLVQRPLYFAIVDEVDSILIDEARTPLIISGPTDDQTQLYLQVDGLIPQLVEAEDYEVDQKQRSVTLTDSGVDKAEHYLQAQGLLPAQANLYDTHYISLVHHVTQALRAHVLYRRDAEYIVRTGDKGPEVVLIDEFTGRMMPGRRLSEGLHQAIEAKEGVPVQQENQTMASITFQNFFRLYPKLAGMTGTAATEAEEFENIYNLQTLVIPTNVPVARKDAADIIYPSKKGKLKAIVADIADCHARGQPVLVGTTTIEKSEELANALQAAQVPHSVLNARFHEQEASIVAQAGRKGAVTIATNMAGRGTDIKLGGNLELLLADAKDAQDAARIRAAQVAEHAAVMAAGGLKVLGTERHESRRIDNQLRGRSGRQGDVGASVFYLSMQDDLIKRFVPNIEGLLGKLNVPDDEAVQMAIVSKSIENAQNKIEALNFDLRKNILKYDEVLNDQRKVVYDQRTQVLHTENLAETLVEFRHDVLDALGAEAFPPEALPEQWQPDILSNGLKNQFGLDLPLHEWLKEADVGAAHVMTRCRQAADEAWAQKVASIPPEVMRSLEKSVILQTLDRLWRQHLQALDFLRKGIGLRGYAQKDPLNEYGKESFVLFEDMMAQVKRDVVALLARIQLMPASAETPVSAAPAPQASQEVATRTLKKPLPNKSVLKPAPKGRTAARKGSR